MNDIRADLEPALQSAHLPSLVCALVQLTGDASLLRSEWVPKIVPFARGETGIAPEEQDKIRALALHILCDHFADPKPAPVLSPANVRAMMNFVTGAEISDDYAVFLRDEMALDGETSKEPRWDTPLLKQKAQAIKVIVVGAGMSGLLAGIRLSQAGIPFEIIEKNTDVGGTWLENTYPGCRVDSSNHIYSYTFAPHAWPQHFSSQPVLLDYFREIAERFNLREHIRFETSVEEAAFDEEANVWNIRLRTKSGEEKIQSTALITAVGQLNRPRLPDIKGRDSFKGVAFHSAQWRHDVDLTGKRVIVIGTGASAFQFVPEIAGKVKSLEILQRTPPWAFPSPNYHSNVPPGMNWALEKIPFYEKWYRFQMFYLSADGFLAAVRADPDWNGPQDAVSARNEAFKKMVTGAITHQVGDDPDLLSKVIPNYPIGGKRALLDNGVWIKALKQDNVDLLTTPIREINAKGVITEDGALHEADVIIYGTGFYASKFLAPMKIKGLGGRDLHEQWAGDPRAYLGITTPGFPNLFMIYGPNTNIVVNASIIFFSECAVRYILGCLQMLVEEGASALSVRQDVCDAFNVKVDAGNALMAWGAPQVSSWYKGETGRVTQNWPFALVDYWRETLKPNKDDFVLAK